MKRLRILMLLMAVSVCDIAVAQFDTVSQVLDTTICSGFDTTYQFVAPYDTAQYDFSWYYLGSDTLFSEVDSIQVIDLDSIILISNPVDINNDVLVDSIWIDLAFYPNINLNVPVIQCYEHDTIMLEYDSSFKDDTSFIFTNLETNEIIIRGDSLVNVMVGNGDSIQVEVKYEVKGCEVYLDSFEIGNRLKPISKFTSIDVCHLDTTIIINDSSFDSLLNSFSMVISGENLPDFDSVQNEFKVLLPVNGDIREVYIEMDLNGCIEYDTFNIKNKLLPYSELDTVKICENEMFKIKDNGNGIRPNAKYILSFEDIEMRADNDDLIIFDDTLRRDVYDNVSIITDNQNGCLDTNSISFEIDSVTYVSFPAIDTTFCESQTEIQIESDFGDGIFKTKGDQFENDGIDSIGEGIARYAPLMADSNIVITYTYTNSEGCTDTHVDIVDIVHPKPVMTLIGFLDEYCHFDPANTITLDQVNPDSSLYEISRDGEIIFSQLTLVHTFNPDTIGSYELFNFYTDEFGCFDSIRNSFIVHPLPQIALDSSITITPLDEVELGDDFFEENVQYAWSDSSTLPYVEVNQPGIYILKARNTVTTCVAVDTSIISYDSNIETSLVGVSISPNPASNFVNIRLTNPISGILIFDVFGDLVNFDGILVHSTSINGELNLDLSNLTAGYYYIFIPRIGNFLLVKS